MLPKIAVLGNGYWGRNLVRNFHALGVLKYVCDSRSEALQEAHDQFGVATCSSLDDLINDSEIQGVAIAAPAAQHYQLTKECLLAGKDVYVEKPLSLRVDEGKELVEIAEAKKLVLMVGHILQYHPAIVKLKELIGAGVLGRIQYIYSSRLNWGKLRSEENILWSFAPHDISAILYLLDEVPISVTASGGSYINPQIYDTTLTACEFQSGVKVLEVLDACERSLHSRAISVQVHESATKYFADSTAVIDGNSEIGRGTKIWHFSHVMTGSWIGRDCNLGQNVVISPGVRIGNRVKIQNNVSVYTGVELEDDVFCGPSMVFTNVINPRSHVERKHEYKRTLVRRGATIGANATIICGVRLGQYCFVAAGAVVTSDVPDYALVMGVPAVQTGWVCICGDRLR